MTWLKSDLSRYWEFFFNFSIIWPWLVLYMTLTKGGLIKHIWHFEWNDYLFLDIVKTKLRDRPVGLFSKPNTNSRLFCTTQCFSQPLIIVFCTQAQSSLRPIGLPSSLLPLYWYALSIRHQRLINTAFALFFWPTSLIHVHLGSQFPRGAL